MRGASFRLSRNRDDVAISCPSADLFFEHFLRPTRLPHLAPPLRSGARGRCAPVGKHGFARRGPRNSEYFFLFVE
jgi:hypothetical protein